MAKSKMPTYGTGKGSNPTGVAGGDTSSTPAKPFAPPAGKGQPIAMKKALAKKSMPSKGL
jgi:hypothetical protein